MNYTCIFMIFINVEFGILYVGYDKNVNQLILTIYELRLLTGYTKSGHHTGK